LVDNVGVTPALVIRLFALFFAAEFPSTVSIDCSDNALFPFHLRQLARSRHRAANKTTRTTQRECFDEITLTRGKAERIRSIAGACPQDYKIER
jgi:hypothetical protein